MPVGIVAYELSASSSAYVRRLRAKVYSEGSLVRKSLRKHLTKFLTQARPCNVTVLLLGIAFYLVLSRCGPVLAKVGESIFETFDLNGILVQNLDPVGLQSLKGVYTVFRGVTRVPGPFAHR